MNRHLAVVALGDNKLEAKLSIDSHSEKEMEILGVDGRNIVKLKSKIIKDSAERTTNFGGEKKTETDKKELQGETVLSELKMKTWTHVLDRADPTPKQEKELKNFDEPENDDDLYPAEKVKVGHSWNIEPSAFKKLLGSKFSDAKGKGKSKFIKVEKVGEEVCAVIESEIDLTGKIKDDDGNDITVEIKGKIINHRSIALGMDIKFTIEGDAVFTGKIDENGQKADVRFVGKISSSGTATVKKR